MHLSDPLSSFSHSFQNLLEDVHSLHLEVDRRNEHVQVFPLLGYYNRLELNRFAPAPGALSFLSQLFLNCATATRHMLAIRCMYINYKSLEIVVKGSTLIRTFIEWRLTESIVLLVSFVTLAVSCFTYEGFCNNLKQALLHCVV